MLHVFPFAREMLVLPNHAPFLPGAASKSWHLLEFKAVEGWASVPGGLWE